MVNKDKNIITALYIIQLICFTFWIIAKIPTLQSLAFFNIVYQLLVFIMIALSIVLFVAFAFLWIKKQFKCFTTEYFALLLSIATLIIMRFVEKIDLLSLFR